VRLFVANCTKQNLKFYYRLPENKSLKEQMIPIGTQASIHGPHLTMQDIDSIIKQHEPYGMKRSDELDRARDFVGMCYSVDRPCDVRHIENGMRINQNVLDERGKALRTAAAVAQHNAIEQQLERQGLGDLKSFKMEIEEVAPHDGYAQGTPRADAFFKDEKSGDQATGVEIVGGKAQQREQDSARPSGKRRRAAA
jgi:hypothetical protein